MNALNFGPADRELFLLGAGERAEKLRAFLAPGVFEGHPQAALGEQILAEIKESWSAPADRPQLPYLSDRTSSPWQRWWRRITDWLGQRPPESALDRLADTGLDFPLAAFIDWLVRRSLALELPWLLTLVVGLPPAGRSFFFQMRRQLRPTGPQVIKAGGGAPVEEGD